MEVREEYRVSDGAQLFLVVSPSGSKRWVCHVQVGGRRSRLSLGVWPEVSLAEARKRNLELRESVRNGEEVLVKKRSDMTFEDLANDWLKLHVRTDGTGWSESHAERCRHIVSAYLCPALGSRIPSEITAVDVRDVLLPLWEAKAATAEKAFSAASCIFQHGIGLGVVTLNVCPGLRRTLPPSQKQRHFVAVTEPDAAGRLMHLIWTYPNAPIVKHAMQFHAWTAARSQEVRGAVWTEIDIDAALWTIPAERMKVQRPHAVPLPSQCVAMLHELHALSRGSAFLFPSLRTTMRPISENTVLAALRSLGYSRADMTTHGFRSMFSTMANESGKWSGDLIEAQLAHVGGDPVRRAYNRAAYIDRRREMMQWWADYLDELRLRASNTA